MAKRALSWRRAAEIGWRDLRSSPGKFVFVVLSVAVGVAALVGVRGFSDSFRQTLGREARALMGGDLSARLMRRPTEAEQKRVAQLMAASGARSTWAVETLSMATVEGAEGFALVTLKAVDPAEYPYYGAAVLEPAMRLREALEGDSAVVAEEFLIRMNAHVGERMRLGTGSFRIAAILREEPDRMTAGAGMGPRVMVSRASLERAGLLGLGSRASQRLLVKLPERADPVVARKQLEAALGDAQVMDYKEGNPALNEGLERATAILSLICLVAMVLGAIGVAMAMHAHLEQRMNMLAILKAMGAGSGDLLRIFLLQTLGLGLVGGLLGVAAGVGVMAAMPAVFGKLLPVHAVLAFPWRSAAAGLATGLVTTLLFCLPPLMDVRAVRPVMVLRRLVEPGPEGVRGWLGRWWARRLQLGLAALMVVLLGGIAWALSDSATVGGAFAAIFTAALAVLLVQAAVVLRVLRWLLNRVRLRLPSSVRQGLANLYRPGNQSAAVMAALGAGVMLILTVYLTQATILRELRETAAPSLPNVFTIDVATGEAAGVKALFARQTGRADALDLMPVVRGRFVSLNGVRLEDLRGQHMPRRMLENAELSWADQPPAGDRLAAGAWWTATALDSIAVEAGTAERLKLGVGSAVELEIGGTTHALRVAALYRADGQHLGARVAFLLPAALLRDQPATWFGGARVNPRQVAALERELFRQYPTVTVINLAEVMARIETVVDQITFVVRFLAGFSILAGLAILASSIASTRFRRMREAVVLKTLGATRMRIVRTFSVEFSVLGLLAGLVGVVFANLLTRVVLERLQVSFHLEWGAAAVALGGTAILATAAGWMASHRILGLRPLEVLRDE